MVAFVNLICAKCGSAFQRRKSRYRPGRTKYCSRSCINRIDGLSMTPERQRERSRRWWLRHLELARKRAREGQAKLRARDPERARAKGRMEGRKRYKRYPERYLFHARVRQMRIKAGEGTFTQADLDRIRARQKNRCIYCRARLKKGAHIDHIIPIALGGTNWPSNLQWLCATCNLSKGARLPELFARTQGLLL